MLYRIKLICEEADGFLREYKIDSEATFLEFNNIILKSCGYQDDMTSFFLCDDEWERCQQVTREDMGSSVYDDEAYVMGDTRLNELIDGEGQKMEFIFDPFNERSFYLKVQEEILGEDLDEAVVCREKGEAPQQINAVDTEDLVKTLTAAKVQTPATDEDDDDLYDPYGIGGDTYNDDEFDAEAYEISDGPLY